MPVDFGKTADDYAQFRADFPSGLFVRLARYRVGLPGQRILDLGAGTGALARGLASQGSLVVALDRSASMLAQAARLAARQQVELQCLAGLAEAVPLADERFDAVTAGQCWHWFDRTRAVAEVRRVLRPGGRLAICHFDWLPLPGNLVEATEALITRHNPSWSLGGGIGVHPQWLIDVREAGFVEAETFSFDLEAPYTHEGWRGRMRASSGIAASLGPEGVVAFDRDLAETMRRDFPQDPLRVAHTVFGLVCRKPQSREPQRP